MLRKQTFELENVRHFMPNRSARQWPPHSTETPDFPASLFGETCTQIVVVLAYTLWVDRTTAAVDRQLSEKGWTLFRSIAEAKLVEAR